MPDKTDEDELSPRAKLAILAYVFFLLAPPAIAVSILSFFAGMIIKEGAMHDALSKALADVNAKTVEPIVQANLDAERAKAAAFTPEQIHHARKLIDGGENRQKVAESFKVGRKTLWRALSKSELR